MKILTYFVMILICLNINALSDNEKHILQTFISALACGAMAYVCKDQQDLQKTCLLNSLNYINNIVPKMESIEQYENYYAKPRPHRSINKDIQKVYKIILTY